MQGSNRCKILQAQPAQDFVDFLHAAHVQNQTWLLFSSNGKKSLIFYMGTYCNSNQHQSKISLCNSVMCKHIHFSNTYSKCFDWSDLYTYGKIVCKIHIWFSVWLTGEVSNMQRPWNKWKGNFHCNILASYTFPKRRYEHYITENKWNYVDRRSLTSSPGLSSLFLLRHHWKLKK